MAYVSKQPVYLDESDIEYLKQFPAQFWAQALKMRYNDFILNAFKRSPGEVSGAVGQGWSDIQQVHFVGDKRHINPMGFSGKIHTGITVLLQKLKRLGYDFSGVNPSASTSLYLGLMKPALANKLKAELISTISAESVQKYKKLASQYRTQGRLVPKEVVALLNPKPNIVYFVPNKLMSNRHDPEPGYSGDSYYERVWNEFKPKVNEIINYYVKNLDKVARNKTNAIYWGTGAKDEHGQTLTQQLFNYTRSNWKNIKHDEKSIKNYIILKINTILQNGIISRRLDDQLKLNGINMYDVIKKLNWSPEVAKNFIDSNKTHGNIYSLVDAINKLIGKSSKKRNTG